MSENVETPIIEVKNLVKRFKDLVAVNDTSFKVNKGECFGLLGPNGAGKSTTLEILETVKSATSGEILFQGKPLDSSYKNYIGIQFQSTALQDHMTITEALQLFSSFYKKTMNIDELIETCQLSEYANKDHRLVSGGQRQRLLLALSLINDPEVIFLDEPTTGLDPHARVVFWNLIRKVKSLGKTIILTTHYMDEAHGLCDELVIMDHGKIIAQGSPSELLEQNFKGRTLVLPQSLEVQLKSSEIAYEVIREKILISTQNTSKTLIQLQGHNINLDQIEVRSQNLEDLFIKLTGDEL